MKRHIRWRLVGILVGLGLLTTRVGAETRRGTGAEEALRQAYLSVVGAELSRAEDSSEKALAAYRKALELFQKVQAEYPGWQADAVSYRIADCSNAILSIEGRCTPDDVAAPTAPVCESNAVPRLERLLDDLRRAQALLAGGGSAAGQAANAALMRELNRVRAERDDAVRAHQALLRKQARRDAQQAGDSAIRTNEDMRLLPVAVKSEARKMMEAGDNLGAMALLREAGQVLQDDPERTVLQGVASCRAGRYDEAVALLKPLDTRGITNADALVTLGSAYMGLGQVGESRVATEKALQANARSPEANYNMAQILMVVIPPDPETAEQYYRRAVALGLPPDADLENALRVATIMARLKKRK